MKKTKNNSKTNPENSLRHKTTILVFLFFSLAGAGGVGSSIGQWVEWHNNTFILYMIASVIYAVPFLLMIFEFSSLKKLKNAESGYQTWLNLVGGRKFGFMGGFFYFFVNLFYFLVLIPNLVNYMIITFGGQAGIDRIMELTGQVKGKEAAIWFRPVISIASIFIFWIATYISAKGPKILIKLSKYSAFVGLTFTLIFIVGAFVKLGQGSYNSKGAKVTLHMYSKFDLTWRQLGSLSWALQALGGLEALAAYKNNIKGGEQKFRLALWLNVLIFTFLIGLSSLLVQAIAPREIAEKSGLLSSGFALYRHIGMPAWWINVMAGTSLITVTLGSLMIWTAAPAKILFTDAPKGIFGKRISKVTKEGTPINGLIAQGIIVTVFFILQAIGSLTSKINYFMLITQNLNSGAATIPVLFMIIAYIKMVWQRNNPNFDRTFKAVKVKGWKGTALSIILVAPMAIIFTIATLTSLIPAEWDQEHLRSSIIQIVLGPIGIMLGFLYTNIIFNKWKKRNPNDKTFFNELKNS